MKKLSAICSLIVFILGASCSKGTNQEPVKEANHPKAKLPDVIYQTNVDPNSVFSVSRSGQSVKIQWHFDFSACKTVDILRNKTGIPRMRYEAARLRPHIQEFEDALPDAGAYWYWLRVITQKGEHRHFGPIRVAPDSENIGVYSNIADAYPWAVHRTYTSASISWNFPNIKYQQITIKRNTSQSTAKWKSVHATLEWNSTFIDILPDPEADYWYWAEAWLDNGTVISQGPVKADYISN